ncbi:MAG TPA: hypothetical protein VMR98_02160, partial [Candidatus Polarisedimenticolaceae bacterium]|nr:hypothetical protein [Candidatus Polarisedimenticolaceae bacterium]
MSVVLKQYVLVAPLTYTGTASAGFTYETPSAKHVTVGQIVQISLGQRQSLGVVIGTGTTKPAFATKPLTQVLELPPLPAHLVKLAAWLSTYYFASPKAVWQTLLPAGITRKRRAAKIQVDGFSLKPQDQTLTPDQNQAFKGIMEGTETTYLVQGVTGSGKTRLYLELT